MPIETASKLDELLNALAEEIGDSKDKGRNAALKMQDREDGLGLVADTLKKKYLGKRTAAEAEKAGELERLLKEAKDESAELRQQVKDLEGKEPNWQRRLEENDRKWQAKLDAAESKVAEERSSSLADKVNIERQKFLAALRVGQEGGVDEDFGRFIPAEYRDHFVPDAEARTVKVREIGEKDSYYDPADGEPAEQLARDVIAKLPPKARIAGTPEGGGGTQNGGGTVSKAMSQVIDAKRARDNYVI